MGIDALTPETESITEGQAAWYHSTSKALEEKHGQVPAFMFFHVPLTEYKTAVTAPGAKISGHYNEGVCCQPGDGGLFKALQDRKDVKATFVGHDHTNDFCVLYEGIQLCYEGSPGFQGYGRKDWPRRARVTQIRDFGKQVWSWKRLDWWTGGGAVVDKEMLWEEGKSVDLSHRGEPSAQ